MAGSDEAGGAVRVGYLYGFAVVLPLMVVLRLGLPPRGELRDSSLLAPLRDCIDRSASDDEVVAILRRIDQLREVVVQLEQAGESGGEVCRWLAMRGRRALGVPMEPPPVLDTELLDVERELLAKRLSEALDAIGGRLPRYGDIRRDAQRRVWEAAYLPGPLDRDERKSQFLQVWEASCYAAKEAVTSAQQAAVGSPPTNETAWLLSPALRDMAFTGLNIELILFAQEALPEPDDLYGAGEGGGPEPVVGPEEELGGVLAAGTGMTGFEAVERIGETLDVGVAYLPSHVRLIEGYRVFAWYPPFADNDVRTRDRPAVLSGPVLAVRVADLDVKRSVLAGSSTSVFAVPQFDAEPVVLVQLDSVDEVELEALMTDARDQLAQQQPFLEWRDLSHIDDRPAMMTVSAISHALRGQSPSSPLRRAIAGAVDPSTTEEDAVEMFRTGGDLSKVITACDRHSLNGGELVPWLSMLAKRAAGIDPGLWRPDEEALGVERAVLGGTTSEGLEVMAVASHDFGEARQRLYADAPATNDEITRALQEDELPAPFDLRLEEAGYTWSFPLISVCRDSSAVWIFSQVGLRRELIAFLKSLTSGT